MKIEGDDYVLGDGYTCLSKSYVVRGNDTSIIATHSTSKIDYFHKVLSILGDVSEGEYSRYQVTLVPADDYFKKQIRDVDSGLNNLKTRKLFGASEKENKQLSTAQR